MKENAFIEEADIICTTLSTGANKVLSQLANRIDYLIVDEACQCSELTSLHPFCLNPMRVVFVGDHKQLPATIMSDNKDLTKYERSLFERLVDAGQPVVRLTVQYRMHPIIRKFPSDAFYDGKLTDASIVAKREQH